MIDVLGGQIVAGIRITFEVKGNVARLWDWVPLSAPRDETIRQTVVDVLSPHLDVFLVDVQSSGRVGVEVDTYTARVMAAPRVTYGSIADLKSVVKGAFWLAAGAEPIVTAPEYGDPRQPGEQDSLSQVATIAKWAAVLGVAGAVVYVGSKVS